MDTGRTEEASSNLHFLFMKLWMKRWWVVLSAIAGAVLFLVVAAFVTPVYSGTAVLVPNSSERGSTGVLGSALGSLGGLASFAGLAFGNADMETQEAIAVLQSREFTERFILENNLMPVLFAKRWDPKKGTWKNEKKAPTLYKAYRLFHSKVCSVSQNKKTGLVTVSVRWTDREAAAAWANDLVRRLNAEMRARAIEKANQSIAFLENELEATQTVPTRQAIGRLIETQVKQRMLANVTEQYAFRVVDKALPQDADRPVWPPRRLILLVAGLFVGGFISVVSILGFGALLEIRRAAAEIQKVEEEPTRA
jgi:uncharacterized protein involved in exopolysaccharide biosynthesis